MIAPDPSSSLELAVGATSDTFGASMTSGSVWMLVADVACWIAQGDSPTATAGAGSMYVPAGVVLAIDGSAGADLAVIQDSAGGKSSLTRARRL